ncbi:MAG: YihY/virulence factor BrkB family protein [Prevotella sp.]|jgi:membrane protein
MEKRDFSVNKVLYYFRRTIWQEGNVKFREHPLVYMAQRLYMVFKGLFVENHWGYAAQLTFNTMMAIIPVFAVIFAVGRGFGFEEYISAWVHRLFISQPDVAEVILKLAGSYIEYTHTGVVIGISLVFMLYSVISLFNNVEGVFNGIWAVKRERSWGKAAFDYVSIIFLVPLAIVLFSGLSVFFYSVLGQLPDFQVLTPLLKAVIGFVLPLAVMTLFFMLMYMFVPNTKVRLSMVWLPSLLAGLCIIGLQKAYIHYQVLFTSYSLIYGSLAALPLLMLWMQLSWFICIGFAELGRANQELTEGHLGEDRADSLLEKIRKSGVVLSLLCHRQRRGWGPCPIGDLQTATRFSYAQLMCSLNILVDAHLVARTFADDDSELYTLNRDAGELGVGTMVNAILGRKTPVQQSGNSLQPSPEVEQKLEEMMQEYLDAMDAVKVESFVNS